MLSYARIAASYGSLEMIIHELAEGEFQHLPVEIVLSILAEIKHLRRETVSRERRSATELDNDEEALCE